jgi:hypothetical protein
MKPRSKEWGFLLFQKKTMKTKQLDFPIIDAHVHLYPDALAPKVVPMLSERFGNAPAFDGTGSES